MNRDPSLRVSSLNISRSTTADAGRADVGRLTVLYSVSKVSVYHEQRPGHAHLAKHRLFELDRTPANVEFCKAVAALAAAKGAA